MVFHERSPTSGGIHLCTKSRNRLLSSFATMLMGEDLITADHLVGLIESSSKLNHNLVKSDILPRDRQNYSSCEKISSKMVLIELESNNESRATRIYLQISLPEVRRHNSEHRLHFLFMYHSSFTKVVLPLLIKTRIISIAFTTPGLMSFSFDPGVSAYVRRVRKNSIQS